MPEYHKNILYLDKDNQIKSEAKIKIIFNFDVGKLIEPKQFKKDEKKEK